MNYIILTSFILKDESTLSLRGIRYEIQSHAVTCRYRCQGFQVIRVASQACQMSIAYCTIMYIEKVVTKRKYLHFRSYSIYRYDSPDYFHPMIYLIKLPVDSKRFKIIIKDVIYPVSTSKNVKVIFTPSPSATSISHSQSKDFS